MKRQGFITSGTTNMSKVHNQEWAAITEELVQNPDDFEKWEKLVQVAEKGDSASPKSNHKNRSNITKSSPAADIEILRESYSALLNKYPFCHNHWINYANWEFKLDNPEKSISIFEDSLLYLPYNLEIWINYLQLLILNNYNNTEDIIGAFEKARNNIGYHFFSHEFYDLYLKFLQTNSLTKEYFVLLRVIIEIPLYHYSKFFSLLVDQIEKAKTDDLTNFKYIVPEKEAASFGLTQKANKTKLVAKLRKIITDIYITTQYKVYELLPFESKISNRSYFSVSYLSQEEILSWETYLEFLEIKKYPLAMIRLAYERCITVCASYPQFWVRFADFYIANSKKLESAKQILLRGIQFTPMTNNYDLKLKLINLEIFQGNFLKARDIVLENLRLSTSFLPYIIKLISLERTMHPNDDEYLLSLFKKFIAVPEINVEGVLFREMLNYKFKSCEELNALFAGLLATERSFTFWDSYMECALMSNQKETNSEWANEIYDLGRESVSLDSDKAKFIKKWGPPSDRLAFSKYSQLPGDVQL